MSPSKKISKRTMKQDRFVSTTLKTSEYVQLNKKYFIGGGIAVIVAILSIYLVSYTNSQKTVNSENMFGNAQLSAAMSEPGAAVEQYKEILSQYPHAEVADRACYYLARSEFDQGKFDTALVYYERYITDYGKEPLLLVGAYGGAAVCYEKQDNYAKAADYYIKAAETADNDVYSPGYLMDAGRTYKEANMLPEAQSAYQQLVDKYNRSTYFSMARKKLAEVQYAQK